MAPVPHRSNHHDRGLRFLYHRHGVPVPTLRLVLHRTRLPQGASCWPHSPPDRIVGDLASPQSLHGSRRSRRTATLSVSRSRHQVRRQLRYRVHLRTNRDHPHTGAPAPHERLCLTLSRHRPVLILGRRHLAAILSTYITHYNTHRPHHALDQRPPDGPQISTVHHQTLCNASPYSEAGSTNIVRSLDEAEIFGTHRLSL